MRFTTWLVSSLLSTATLAAPAEETSQLDKRQAKQLIDPTLFPILKRYTLFSAAALVLQLSKSCPAPPANSTYLTTYNNPPLALTNTQASIFRDDTTKEFIVSFPGTSSVRDFLTDFTAVPVRYNARGLVCEGCKVHKGFNDAWESVRPQTVRKLRRYLHEYPDYTITVTGHSLGGAIAAIAYPSLKATDLPINAAYTFGQPRVGNAAFADFVDALSSSTQTQIGEYYRTTHSFDGVPQLPSENMGFRHSRTEFFELDNKQGTQVAGRTFRCFGQEAPDCNKGRGRGFINEAHLMYSGVQMTGSEGCGG